ncbi:MAG: NUDIX domain-containing protein [Candidatus Aenigmarchaeota archaeon]|nr:NUDIX domain-containing protein [Candidatus Aenigmarchaeota archaeon]
MKKAKPVVSHCHYYETIPHNEQVEKILRSVGFEVSKTPDFIVACGGDGTFAKIAGKEDLPILFVRDRISVGALAEISIDKLPYFLEKIKKGEFFIQKFMRLEANSVTAFSDIYFTHTTGAESIQYRITSKNFEVIMTSTAVVFSTPQGSSGYSKSAGAPVIKKRRILVTHVCPYEKIKYKGKVLKAPDERWHIFKPEKKIRFELLWPEKANMHADGEFIRTVEKGEVITIKKSRKDAEIIRFEKEREYVDVVDAVVIDSDKILLVKRGIKPFKGKLALPGGHVEKGEDEEDAIRREVEEETGITIKNPVEFAHFYGEKRDPRYPTYSVVFSATPENLDVKPGSDAKEALWFPIRKLYAEKLAFDHWKIINEFFKWKGKTIGDV